MELYVAIQRKQQKATNPYYSTDEPYNDSLLIKGRLSSKESKKIPSIFPYFTVPFTKEGIMQAWLLNSISDYMAKGWHANYGRIKYIYNINDINSIFPPSPSSDLIEARNKIMQLDSKTLLPDIIIDGDNAFLKICFWNGWSGLVQRNQNVTKVGNSIQFGEFDNNTLVNYDCGIIF